MSQTHIEDLKMNSIGVIVCGGVISESEMQGKDFYEIAMLMILPDEQYKQYIALIEQGKHKEAHEIFKKYAWSLI
jgi:hypothetical protein